MPVEQGHTCYITTCPRHKRRLKLGDTGTLYINMTTGMYPPPRSQLGDTRTLYINMSTGTSSHI